MLRAAICGPGHWGTRLIAAVQAKPAYRHSLWGIEVRDLATGQVLIARNSQQLYVPGSIFKTFSPNRSVIPIRRIWY